MEKHDEKIIPQSSFTVCHATTPLAQKKHRERKVTGDKKKERKERKERRKRKKKES